MGRLRVHLAALLAAGRQVGREGPLELFLRQVQGLVQEGHVVLVVNVAEGRLEVKKRAGMLLSFRLETFLVRLARLACRQETVRHRLQSRVVGACEVPVVKVEAKLVDVVQGVHGCGHTAHLSSGGGRDVRALLTFLDHLTVCWRWTRRGRGAHGPRPVGGRGRVRRGGVEYDQAR